MAKLSDNEIQTALGGLPAWSYGEGALSKRFSFTTFPAGIAFVNRVAEVAEQVGHHPDITITYSTITLRLSTHDAGGVTEKDLDLARRIDAVSAG
jgi:4a-hydroxytetrahydrobiopterin dehydratase